MSPNPLTPLRCAGSRACHASPTAFGPAAQTSPPRRSRSCTARACRDLVHAMSASDGSTRSSSDGRGRPRTGCGWLEGEVGHPRERGGVARHDSSAAPRRKRRLHDLDPRWSRLGRPLLVEEFAADAVRMPDEHVGRPPAPRSAPSATARCAARDPACVARRGNSTLSGFEIDTSRPSMLTISRGESMCGTCARVSEIERQSERHAARAGRILDVFDPDARGIERVELVA